MARTASKKKRLEKTEHIINIATQVFAEKGYHGALTDEIADRAKISKRSMYYYVGEKDTLYETVINRLMEQVSKLVNIEVNEDVKPQDAMSRYIRGLAQVAKIKYLHEIVLREFFDGQGKVPSSLFSDTDKTIKYFINFYEKGKKEGVFNDIDPFLLVWIIFGFFVHWQLTMPSFYKAGIQKTRLKTLGFGVSPKLVKEVEKIFFQIILKQK